MEAGLIQGYSYTTTSYDLNIYSKVFRKLLSFKTSQEARRCVEQLDNLHYFERIGDRAGTTLRPNGSANRAQPCPMVWQTQGCAYLHRVAFEQPSFTDAEH